MTNPPTDPKTTALREAIEKLLLKQAKLTLASPDKRSANKYTITDDLLALFQTAIREARIDELKKLPITEDEMGWAVGAEVVETRIKELEASDV